MFINLPTPKASWLPRVTSPLLPSHPVLTPSIKAFQMASSKKKDQAKRAGEMSHSSPSIALC